MMRVIAAIGMMVAAVFVGYSAIVLYHTGYNATALEWQKPLYGAAASIVVVYEGIAILFAAWLWREKSRGLALGCILLLVTATAWTFRLELINQVDGQADRIAGRQAIVSQVWTDTGQLAALTKQQGIWTAKIETATGRALAEFRAALDRTNQQVAEIISRINQRQAVAEVAPDAALASRLIGGTEALWRDMMMLLSLGFWPLARILATPAAVEFWRIATRPAPKRTAFDFDKLRRDAAKSEAVKPSVEAEASNSTLVAKEPPPAPKTALPRLRVPSEESLLRGVLAKLPSGPIQFADIEAKFGAACMDHDIAPNRERLIALLATLKIAPAKKTARGARYNNTLGRMKGLPVSGTARAAFAG